MKTTFSICCAFAAVTAFGMPEATGVTLVQDSMTKQVTVRYSLSEAAIVTFSFLTNGVPLEKEQYASAKGDGIAYGVKLDAGSHEVTWKPYQDWPEAGKNIPLEAKVTVWATNNPPTFIVCDLRTKDAVTYYENEADIPGGVQDNRYKDTHLLFKRVRAAGVPWEMGSPSVENGRDNSREALHPVTLTNDFYLCVYELTQGQVFHLTGSRPYSAYGGGTAAGLWNPYPVSSYNSGALADLFNYVYLRCSTNQVDDGSIHWPETGHAVGDESFMALVRDRTGLTVDLPVEAQWEFAARAGCTTGLYDGYNLTNTTSDAHLDTIAWYSGNCKVDGSKTTHPVGGKTPNAWGFYDMLGNVSELCLDWYLGNPGDIDFNLGPATSSSTTARCRRGGACVNYDGNTCRVNYRDAYVPSSGRYDIGCRLAITLCY